MNNRLKVLRAERNWSQADLAFHRVGITFAVYGEGGDTEALHDFRVALRRLRSTLRTYRPWLGDGARRKHVKRLRAVARFYPQHGAKIGHKAALGFFARDLHSLASTREASR